MNDLTRPGPQPAGRRIGRAYLSLPKLPEIPRARYTDEAFFQAEMEHVFRRTWLQVSHVSEFEGEGNYRAFDLAMAPIIVVRGKDGVLRAFLNTCRHRGSKVIQDEHGRARSLICRYHRWTYDLTGRLTGLPMRDVFTDLDLESHSLISIRCELWGGFVFINFDENAPSLMDWIEPMARRFNTQANAPLRIVSKQSYDMNCNWKFAVEAFREPYHVATVHPDTVAKVLDGYDAFQEMYPNGGGTLFIPYTKSIMEQDFSGVPLNQTTLAVLPGMEDKTETTLLADFFPNVIIGFQPTGFPLIITWPLAVDRCRMEVHWYGMDWGDGPMPEEWNKVVSDFGVLTEEDISNLEGIQKAMACAPDLGVPVSTLECFVYQLHVEIDKAIGEKNVPVKLRVPDVLGEFISP